MQEKTRLERLTDARAELRKARAALKRAQAAADELLKGPRDEFRRALANAARFLPGAYPGSTSRKLDAEIRHERSKPKECCPANGRHGPLPGGCGCHCHEI